MDSKSVESEYQDSISENDYTIIDISQDPTPGWEEADSETVRFTYSPKMEPLDYSLHKPAAQASRSSIPENSKGKNQYENVNTQQPACGNPISSQVSKHGQETRGKYQFGYQDAISMVDYVQNYTEHSSKCLQGFQQKVKTIQRYLKEDLGKCRKISLMISLNLITKARLLLTHSLTD